MCSLSKQVFFVGRMTLDMPSSLSSFNFRYNNIIYWM